MNCVYIAPAERLQELKDEIKNITFEKDNFIMAQGLQKSYWAQNVWIDVKSQKVESIKKAALFLKGLQRKWWHYPLNHVRRTKLIQEELPRISNKPMSFPHRISTSPLGSFTLKTENELLYATQCISQVPNGEFHFETPSFPMPSEAYLKLWEALTRLGAFPQEKELCVDLGSSPGSWTQALIKLGAHVISIDKATLQIPEHSRLRFIKGDAFKFNAAEAVSPQWVFSDIICYPEKLYELALKWKSLYPAANYIFTLKFQGQWDKEATEKFARIPNSTVCHLFNNKHELCWISSPRLFAATNGTSKEAAQ